MAKVWVVDMDVEVDSQDFIIESDLPPPVGAITRTESTYSVQSESGRGATRASQRNNPHNNRDQREPSRLRTMSNAAARFFGVAEDQVRGVVFYFCVFLHIVVSTIDIRLSFFLFSAARDAPLVPREARH